MVSSALVTILSLTSCVLPGKDRGIGLQSLKKDSK